MGVEGGPVERLTDAFGASPRLTPDGATLIFHRGRLEATRPKYQGAGSSDLWKLTMATGQFDRLTTSPFSDGEGFPLADGSVLYVSSRDGANHNLYKLAPTATDATAPKALTNFSLPQADNPATIGHGVRDLNVDTHLSCIKGQVQEMLKSQDSVAPDCVRCMAYHNMLARMKGFDLQDLVGQPPYPDNWEKPRPKFEGEIAETHYAY